MMIPDRVHYDCLRSSVVLTTHIFWRGAELVSKSLARRRTEHVQLLKIYACDQVNSTRCLLYGTQGRPCSNVVARWSALATATGPLYWWRPGSSVCAAINRATCILNHLRPNLSLNMDSSECLPCLVL